MGSYMEDKGLQIGWNWVMMRQVDMWQHIDSGCDREPQVRRELPVAAADWILTVKIDVNLVVVGLQILKKQKNCIRGVAE